MKNQLQVNNILQKKYEIICMQMYVHICIYIHLYLYIYLPIHNEDTILKQNIHELK